MIENLLDKLAVRRFEKDLLLWIKGNEFAFASGVVPTPEGREAVLRYAFSEDLTRHERWLLLLTPQTTTSLWNFMRLMTPLRFFGLLPEYAQHRYFWRASLVWRHPGIFGCFGLWGALLGVSILYGIAVTIGHSFMQVCAVFFPLFFQTKGSAAWTIELLLILTLFGFMAFRSRHADIWRFIILRFFYPDVLATSNFNVASKHTVWWRSWENLKKWVKKTQTVKDEPERKLLDVLYDSPLLREQMKANTERVLSSLNYQQGELGYFLMMGKSLRETVESARVNLIANKAPRKI